LDSNAKQYIAWFGDYKNSFLHHHWKQKAFNNLHYDAKDTICFNWPKAMELEVPKMHFPQYVIFLGSLNNTFSRRHKFTILFIIFRPYCVKVNAICGCHQKLHPFNCNKNRTMMTKWKGWNKKLLHLFNYNKNITTTKWKGLENT
jgi:hypothetical protein